MAPVTGLSPATRKTVPSECVRRAAGRASSPATARGGRVGRGLRAMRAFAAVRASRIACASASAAPTVAGQAARRAARHGALGHAHQDVLDEAADERRVVADPADAEAGGVRDLFQLRDVRAAGSGDPTCAGAPAADRSSPHRSSCRASALMPPQAEGNPRVLADVRVDEQRAARREHAGGLRQHAAQCLGRQVLEHVEGARLGERAVGERQPAQIAEQQIDARGAPRSRRTG